MGQDRNRNNGLRPPSNVNRRRRSASPAPTNAKKYLKDVVANSEELRIKHSSCPKTEKPCSSRHLEGSINIIEHALERDDIKSLPKAHPYVLFARELLATSYFDLHDFRQAEKIYRQVLKVREEASDGQELERAYARRLVLASLKEGLYHTPEAMLEGRTEKALNTEGFELALKNVKVANNPQVRKDLMYWVHFRLAFFDPRVNFRAYVDLLKERILLITIYASQDEDTQNALFESRLELMRVCTEKLHDRKYGGAIYKDIKASLGGNGKDIAIFVNSNWRKHQKVLDEFIRGRWKAVFVRLAATAKTVRQEWYDLSKRVLARIRWKLVLEHARRVAKDKIRHQRKSGVRKREMWRRIVSQALSRHVQARKQWEIIILVIKLRSFMARIPPQVPRGHVLARKRWGMIFFVIRALRGFRARIPPNVPRGMLHDSVPGSAADAKVEESEAWIKNLEGHYASFPVTTKVFQGGGGLLIPSDSIGIAAATSTPMISQAGEQQYRRIDFNRVFSFSSKDTESVTTNVQIIANKATEFLRMFRVFRERFIEPGMMRPAPPVVTEASESALETEKPQGGLEQEKKPRPRIRIALLDTGVLLAHYDLGTELEKVKKYRLKQKFKGDELEPIKTRKSFVKDDKEKSDTCGHGTHLALLLLQYAPDADLYIAKVSSGMEFNDEDSIVKAIQWATGNSVKADIISMSFGCDIAITKVHDAIKDAQSTQGATGHTPLFFAAASNHGLRKKRSFPASDINVVGVYALDGEGFDANHINPPTDPNKPNFGTLGHGIELQWALPGGSATKEVNGKPPQDDPKENAPVLVNNPSAKYKSGTSYATPILAATVANYLAWLDCHASELGPNRHKRAREMEWVVKILSEKMSEKQETHSDMMFVQPWTFFEIPGHDKKNISPDDIRQKDAETTRHCLWAIRDMLKDIDG